MPACAWGRLLGNLVRFRDDDFWAPFVDFDRSGDGHRLTGKGLEGADPADGFNVPGADEPGEDVIGIAPAEVEEGVALREGDLLDEAANRYGFAHMAAGFLRKDRIGCGRGDGRQHSHEEE